MSSQYPSTFHSGALASSIGGLSQEHTYEYQTPVSNGSYSWNQPTRSISSDASDDLAPGFPMPYRTNTYPSFERRMTTPMQQLPPTSSNMVSMGLGSQQNSTHGEFQEPTSYHSMSIGMQQEWGAESDSVQQVSGPGMQSYTQSWYPPPSSMGGMSQDNDHAQVLTSHNRNFANSQRNPG